MLYRGTHKSIMYIVTRRNMSSYTSADIARLSTGLLTARQGEMTISTMTCPAQNVADTEILPFAYKVHAAMEKYPGFINKGWKIGAISKDAQKSLRIKAPFFAPIPATALRESPAKGFGGCNLGGVEAEFAFTMDTELLPRNKLYTEDEVKDAVRDLRPCIELCGTRFSEAISDIPPALRLADGGFNVAVILGKELQFWREANLSRANVKLKVNSKRVASGDGRSVMGHPLTALTWLINSLSKHGMSVEKDQIICTGTMTGMTPVKDGDLIAADFGTFGKIQLNIQ